MGTGCGVLPIFREKVAQFPPDYPHGRHFLMAKKSKSFIEQGC
ncbi:hypothetical protein C789_650 [Microcystis aeruginosa FACHB-905 = DIANCHI905]|uniref:Uncharacterized protein n=1 Tax=Microcystis aeruginosa PCC 7806SL TaxID=1903187 RepID=A0AB33BX19_MICA7|nr:hypothetical protein BH695_1450 [Microcystis aeruginosa PCC 7806SL]ELS49524.1 hypothetical protein C789_650 [Microcystis aeruginosa FACHB-905 = DIANCHI905]